MRYQKKFYKGLHPSKTNSAKVESHKCINTRSSIACHATLAVSTNCSRVSLYGSGPEPRAYCELLAKVAVLADHYKYQTVVHFFADKWIDFSKESVPTVYSRDLVLWIWVSWAFRLDLQFESVTSIAVTQSNILDDKSWIANPKKSTW